MVHQTDTRDIVNSQARTMLAQISEPQMHHLVSLDDLPQDTKRMAQINPLATDLTHDLSSLALNTRLNLLDDQVTILNDLSLPNLPKPEESRNQNKPLKNNASGMSELIGGNDNNCSVEEQGGLRRMKQEILNKEVEFENDVELASTLWLVLRPKKSYNTIL
jgi:hypothetical protein